ncbi:hypothetical protein DCC85_03635 [Paenibacillus sp. CAA11]|uniref:hypothetical protein n=1 Tax=Paenibacillus sp. CAA11 TaxID=1532905 RepID=UPI000D361D3D|nr:hypothetical protein [Paenibacillus sp. CAA11]AWB43401.1 hypothetical protein DCC85_03635 [Paenibacillus sp. CAA11]
MIRLLKYDWKRNATALLGSGAVLIIVQLMLEVFATNPEFRIVMSIMAYSAAAVLIVVMACKTYAQNIVSYSRHLLPVRTSFHVLSPILLALICSIILGIIIILHLMLTRQFIDHQRYVELVQVHAYSLIWAGVLILWVFMTQIITIFLAITISRSFRVKARAWIGLIAYFGIAYVMSFLEHVLQLEPLGWADEIIRTNEKSNTQVIDLNMKGLQGFYSTLAFEFIIACLMFFIIVRLLKRRVES